jgi:lysophospholipase L1-like esterase
LGALVLAQTPAAQNGEKKKAEAKGPALDWPGLGRYHEANLQLPAPASTENRVVFMGDSITDAWGNHFDKYFAGKPYIGRGISGQTTPQMLVRFRPDVIALSPKVVVILAGTNDIAGNTGPETPEMIEDNFASMVDLAKANGIRVVLCSILPVFDYPWKRGLEPAPKIVDLNVWLKDYAARSGSVYVDYFAAMVDERQGCKADLCSDGVHPTEAGYTVMVPLVEKGIAEALARN